MKLQTRTEVTHLRAQLTVEWDSDRVSIEIVLLLQKRYSFRDAWAGTELFVNIHRSLSGEVLTSHKLNSKLKIYPCVEASGAFSTATRAWDRTKSK